MLHLDYHGFIDNTVCVFAFRPISTTSTMSIERNGEEESWGPSPRLKQKRRRSCLPKKQLKECLRDRSCPFLICRFWFNGKKKPPWRLGYYLQPQNLEVLFTYWCFAAYWLISDLILMLRRPFYFVLYIIV